MPITDQEFKDILALGHERRGTEFKGPGLRTDKSYFAKIARAVLGLANHRDGGIIVIGVEDRKGTIMPVGLSVEDLSTWTHDDVSTSIAAYADPSVSFDLQILKHEEGNYVILRVYQFDDIPVLCKQEYSKGTQIVLRKGACYVRSGHKPETSEIPSQEDMRNLLELAIDNGVSKFVARAHKAGFTIGPPPTPLPPNHQALFEAQLKDLK